MPGGAARATSAPDDDPRGIGRGSTARSSSVSCSRCSSAAASRSPSPTRRRPAVAAADAEHDHHAADDHADRRRPPRFRRRGRARSPSAATCSSTRACGRPPPPPARATTSRRCWRRSHPQLSAADLAICHLEVTLARPGRRPVGLPAVPGAAGAGRRDLAEAGLRRLLGGVEPRPRLRRAGRRWRRSTRLDEAGLAHAGTARTPEEDTPARAIYDVDGIAVAQLSYAYGFNGFVRPAGKEWLVDQIDPALILADAQAARAAGAELVVVSLHWGNEYRHEVVEAQQAVADALAAAPGAVDLVVGHHAHVVQPISKVGDLWVVWGMGNLLSNNSPRCCPAESTDGVVVTVTIGDTPDWRRRHRPRVHARRWNERASLPRASRSPPRSPPGRARARRRPAGVLRAHRWLHPRPRRRRPRRRARPRGCRLGGVGPEGRPMRLVTWRTPATAGPRGRDLCAASRRVDEAGHELVAGHGAQSRSPARCRCRRGRRSPSRPAGRAPSRWCGSSSSTGVGWSGSRSMRHGPIASRPATRSARMRRSQFSRALIFSSTLPAWPASSVASTWMMNRSVPAASASQRGVALALVVGVVPAGGARHVDDARCR